MHEVAIYLRNAYQSPNHRPMWSLVLTISCKQHVNKHEIVFHNIFLHYLIAIICKNLKFST